MSSLEKIIKWIERVDSIHVNSSLPDCIPIDVNFMRLATENDLTIGDFRALIPKPDLKDDSLFHRLWTKAVGQPGYNKGEWLELERILRTAAQNKSN